METEDSDRQGILLQWCLVASWPPFLPAASDVRTSVPRVSSDKGSSRWLPRLTDKRLHLAEVLLLFRRILSAGPLVPVEARSASHTAYALSQESDYFLIP